MAVTRSSVRFSDFKNDGQEAEDKMRDAINESADKIIAKNLVRDPGSINVPEVEVARPSSETEAVKPPVEKFINNGDPFFDTMFDNDKNNILHNNAVNSEDVSDAGIQSDSDNDKPVMILPKSAKRQDVLPDKDSGDFGDHMDTRHIDLPPEPVSSQPVYDTPNDVRSKVSDQNDDSDDDSDDDIDVGLLGLTQANDEDEDEDEDAEEQSDRFVSQGTQRMMKSADALKERTICDGNSPGYYMERVRTFPNDFKQFIIDKFDNTSYRNKKLPSFGYYLSAYIFIKEGYPSDMPITQMVSDIVDTYKGEYEISTADIQEKLSGMNDRIISEFSSLRLFLRQEMMKKLNAIELAAVYDVFQGMGFSTEESVGSAEEVDFLEAGEMQRSLDRQAISKMEYDKLDDGTYAYNARFKEKN